MNNQARNNIGRFVSKWTREEVQILSENYLTHTAREIMDLLPRYTAKEIQLKAAHIGLNKQKINNAVIAFELERIREFPSVRAAAQHYGLKESRIYYLIANGGQTANGTSFNYMI